MFRRWSYVRMRAAEQALRNGQIDEAFERLRNAELPTTQQAAKLSEEVCDALLARARLAAKAGNVQPALDDIAKAALMAPLDADARALQARLIDELGTIQRQVASDDANRRAAEDRLRAGRLESAHQAAQRLHDPHARERLQQEFDQRRQSVDRALQQARDALAAGDLVAACGRWQEAVARHGLTAPAQQFLAEILQPYMQQIAAWFQAGRLDLLDAVLASTAALRRQSPLLRPGDGLAVALREAAARLRAGDFAALGPALSRLRALHGEAPWLVAAQRSLDELTSAYERLMASPLGQLVGEPGRTMSPTGMSEAWAGTLPTVAPQSHSAVAGRGAPLDRGLLLLVDGTGSALLLARSRATLGRAGGSADVPIPADILAQHADIERRGEDYVLTALGPARVNGAVVRRARLRDGDRVTLGDSASLVFLKPTGMSETAVLRLSARSRLAQDVSTVVLFGGLCLVGPQRTCHIHTREGDSRIVLFDRGGELFVRRAGRDGRPTGPAEPLPLEKSCDFGDLRLTAKRYSASAGEASAV